MIPHKHFIPAYLRPLLVAILSFAIFAVSYTQGSRKTNAGREEKIASIDFVSSGCFSSRTGLINIFKNEDAMFAEFTVDNKRYKVIKLNPGQVAGFDRFMKEFRSLKEGGGCTTVDTYRVYYGNELVRKRDASCGWNGFDVLRTALSANAHAE